MKYSPGRTTPNSRRANRQAAAAKHNAVPEAIRKMQRGFDFGKKVHAGECKCVKCLRKRFNLFLAEAQKDTNIATPDIFVQDGTP